jgi:hypothetical protein
MHTKMVLVASNQNKGAARMLIEWLSRNLNLVGKPELP